MSSFRNQISPISQVIKIRSLMRMMRLEVFLVLMYIHPIPIKAQVILDHHTTAVRFVFSMQIDRSDIEWIEEEVIDEWFNGKLPKICHICDNVYRYSVDNGSVITRGIRNLINRKKISEILEVREFLTVLVRQIGGNFHAEYFRYDLTTEEPISTRVEQLSKPWF